MAGGQWEVVGGKVKKSKGKNDVLKPSKEKKIKENATFDASAGICESPTMFSAFQEKEEIPKPKVKVTEVIKEKEKHLPAKKKKDKKPSTSKLKLSVAIASVGEDDMLNLLGCLEQLYSEPSLLWLKDLAAFLNVKCDCLVEDPTFGTKPIGYPSSLLDKKVYDLIVKTFNRCKTQTLQLFFDHCVQNMIQDTLKGLNTLGYRIILQCLAQEIPSIVLTRLPKCIELFDSHQNRQNICLSLFWAAGQAGNNNLEAGIRIWVDFMFRSLGTKSCTNYVVEYLEKLLSKGVSYSKSLLTVQDLFPILDAVYSKELAKNIQKRLLAIYPILKTLSYGPKPEDVLHNFFPSYLRRLEPNCSDALKKELLSSLVYCLEKDVRSYRIWRHIYTKHFIQSKLLISHINDKWRKNKCNKKWLLDTLSVFQVTNEEQLNSGKPNPVVEECMLVTKELLSKVNTHMFSWVRITLFFVLIFSLIISYDVWIHNSFIESNTGKLMKDSGLLVVFAHAGEKLRYYYEKTYKLLEVYIPVASKWTQQTISPYLDLFFKLLSTFSAHLWKSSLGIRTWCSVNFHFIAMMVDKHFPVYSAKILSFLNDLLIVLSNQFKIALVYMWHFGNAFITWLQSSDYIVNFVDVSQKYVLTGSAAVREYAVSLLHLLQSYMP